MLDVEERYGDEFRFARQMKDTCCDESGKETNPAKAAEILHQIGLIYRQRSPDKISLIKSAGLLNAAVVRNPPNVSHIKSNLSELCRHILKQSNANNQTADLIGKSQQVKVSVTNLRNEVKVFLKNKVPKISEITSKPNLIALNKAKTTAIQQLNKLIAHKYKQIMAELSQYCENVMGKPPCKYAIVGMGSLAREEITAYSDFEHIILLFDDENYKSYLDYFKWFSVIFHIVVLNVQETIVPSLNIASLNGNESSLGNWFYDDVTPRGICFDGMMPHACKFPLGRQQHTKNKHFTTELIKPVSEMLEYLSSDADLKNGYHLADILTKTCFVFGNEDIFKLFADGARNYHRTKSQTDTINDITQQVKQDLNNFSTRFRLSKLKSQHSINIKQLVYRSTTIFISALARKHKISANSCFDIIDEMANNKQITQNTGEKLKFAIAVACEMRLRVYTKKNCQCDNAIALKQDGIEKFLDIVGVACTISYFQIAYCLQCEVAKELNFTKLHFYTDPQLINITIGLAFGMTNLTSFSKDSQKQTWDSSEFDFDACIEHLESEMKAQGPKKVKNLWRKTIRNLPNIFHKTSASSSNQTDSNSQQIKTVADYLYSAKIFDEAVEFYKQLLDIHKNKPINKSGGNDVAWANNRIGRCLLQLNEPDQALSYFRRCLEIEENRGSCRLNPSAFHNIGMCHTDLHNYDEALTNLNRALEITQTTTLNADTDRDVANTLHEIGSCHTGLHNYDEALTNLNRALEIKQTTTLNADTDRDVAITLHGIGRCHIDLHNYDEALTHLNRALEIKQTTTLNADTDRDVATTLHDIGRCHIDLHNYDEALANLNRALEIQQNTTLNADTDRDVAITLHEIGSCHTDLHNYDEALTNLNRALEITQNTTLNADTDRDVANTLHEIGRCHIDLHNYDEALANLNRALEITQNTTLNADTDRDVAKTLHEIGRCHIDLHNYDEALTNLNRALEIKQNTSLDVYKDRYLAATQRAIGRCLTGLQQYDDSWSCLQQSLKILQNITLDERKDISIAHTLNYMGEYLMEKQQYSEALIYLQKAGENYETEINWEKDPDLATTLNITGICLIELHEYADALNRLKRSLEIYEKLPLNEHIANIVESIRSKMDKCSLKLG